MAFEIEKQQLKLEHQQELLEQKDNATNHLEEIIKLLKNTTK